MWAVMHAGAAGLPSQSNVPDVQMHVDGLAPSFSNTGLYGSLCEMTMLQRINIHFIVID